MIIVILVLIAFALMHFEKNSPDMWAGRLVLAAFGLAAILALIKAYRWLSN